MKHSEDVGYIVASKYRYRVLRALREEDELTPTGISRATDIGPSHVSRSLAGLREEDLIELTVPEARNKGRLYALTDNGERAMTTIEDDSLNIAPVGPGECPTCGHDHGSDP